ncbi:ABC transporter permease [Arthrobacter sp. FW306-05-C]|uniref:ABC transporter permease n=1 Tax=Arthrobacter sp. FW306-05-C TaxID=2879620 RepID=UPI001F396339|nr:ABC transporter permease [Arthrobacter sp. FW306-05-C]UKA66577.1 ABC transporter permease [Arthrobacter sp. FW306-05-C]
MTTTLSPERAAAPASTRRSLQFMLTTGLLPALLILMCVGFAIVEPRFVDGSNLLNVARQSVFLLLIAMGQMIVLINAQLDLSVGATVALTSVVVASVTAASSGGPESVLLGLGAGLLLGVMIGLVNGCIVAFWKVPSFMATLGSTSVLTGLALIISKGAPIIGLPMIFSDVLATSSVLGIPVPVLIGVVVAIGMGVFMSRTVPGRNMYAVGGNRAAALVAGVNVKKTIILAFVLCSGLASLAGILLTARVGSGEASLGASFVMLSIAAAVLGGTSLFGGEGVLWRVVLGVLFLGVLSNGMNLLHVSSYIQELVIGMVLIAAVAAERLKGAA